MRVIAKALLLLTLAVVPFSCGADDPIEQCNELFAEVCRQDTTCKVQEGSVKPEEEETTRTACMTKAAGHCQRAAGVTGDYDECLDAVQRPECPAERVTFIDGEQYEVPPICARVIFWRMHD